MALFAVLLGSAGIIVLYNALNRYRSLSRNITEAKRSGLPFVIAPWHVYSIFWLATFAFWLPILRKVLPASWQGIWLDLMDPEWCYRSGYKPFADVGEDVFLLVDPYSIKAYVADPEVMTQITTRRTDFPKPLELYKQLDMYGKNVITTEGSSWRVHRKLTAPLFSEKNNELVFTESIHHIQALLRLWTGGKNKTISNPGKDVMRFTLYIISAAGFNVRVVWPHEEEQEPADQGPKASFAGSKPPPGHKMNYRDALSTLLENIIWTQIARPKALTKSPFKIHRETGTAVMEWGKFMDEMYEAKKTEFASGQKEMEENPGMDLFQSMIRESGVLDPDKKSELQKSDILGNAFLLMVAGHETTANAIHFSLLFLALNLQSQKTLQKDIDRRLEGRPIEKWTYEEDFPKLFDGFGAAVMNETLRLVQPIINIPKSTPPGRPQPIFMNGKEYLMPGGTHIGLSSAIHRNPKYWPGPDGKTADPSSGRSDADKFRPERWIVHEKLSDSYVDIEYDDEELRGPSGADTSAHLFKPVKGSYIPFSDGYRSCIGKRFAQVEILAVFAVIFSQYSVELAVDDFATDEEIEKMPKGGRERKEVWQKAADRADYLLTKTMGSVLTLQLRQGNVPIRIVKRGEERFMFD